MFGRGAGTHFGAAFGCVVLKSIESKFGDQFPLRFRWPKIICVYLRGILLRLVFDWLSMSIRHLMGMFSFFGEVLGHVSFLGVPYLRTHFWSILWGTDSGA